MRRMVFLLPSMLCVPLPFHVVENPCLSFIATIWVQKLHQWEPAEGGRGHFLLKMKHQLLNFLWVLLFLKPASVTLSAKNWQAFFMHWFFLTGLRPSLASLFFLFRGEFFPNSCFLLSLLFCQFISLVACFISHLYIGNCSSVEGQAYSTAVQTKLDITGTLSNNFPWPYIFCENY